MKLKNLHLLLLLFASFFAADAQVMLTEAAPNATIDFSASMQTTVGTNPSSPYTAAGFSPNPTVAGRLNSNAWDIRGFDFGTLGFGGTQTVDDFGRGQITSPVLSGGLYAYTELPGTAANPAFMIQPTDTDFNPGSIVLKVRNNGTTNMTQLEVSYNLFIRNDEGRASSFNFSHSLDDVAYQSVASLDYTSPEAPDAFQWTQVGVSPSRSYIISGINIAPGQFYYLRWTSQDVSGTGDRDEFGLDDIVVKATYGAPAPEINVRGVSGMSVLTGDTSPTVAKGTDFAPIGSPLSTIGATLNTTFKIENLGGAVLTVSNITITGPQASDFEIFIPSSNNLPTGAIQPVNSNPNYRELTIKFDPSDEGLRKARVTIYNNDADESVYWFDIQGYGIIPKPDINVKGNTGGTANITSGNMIPVAGNNTLWATDQIVGVAVSKDYRIQNTANISSILQLTGTPKVQIGGANPGDFVVTTQPTSTNINGGFGTNFVITFTPQATGIRTALVTIPNNDLIADPFTGLPESPYTFLIQGKGVAPEIGITGNSQAIASGSTSPTLVNYTFFDYLNITGVFLDRTFTIKNTGTVALTLGALTLSGANASEFAIITSPAASVAPNATTTFTIRFDPSSVGVKNAIVNLVNNDFSKNPYTFAIRGYGIDYVPCAYGAFTTIAVQDFEAAPATPTWAYSGANYSVGAGTAYGASGDGGLSDRFLTAKSLQVNNATSTVTFNSVDTSLFSDIELSVRLASLSTTAAEGSDNTDRIIVAISPNGGLSWSNEFDLVGNADAKWSFTSGTGTLNQVYDGDNILANFAIASVGFATATGMGTLRLSGLPKTANLMMRITLINNNAAEIWAIDNVTLYGRKEISTTWTTSGWSNGVPTQTTKAIFDANYNTSTANVQACKCQINAGKTVTVNSGQYLSIESDVENAGSLVIEDGGSLVQRNDFATNIGNITVKRNSTPMRKFDYTYWSSPVSGQTLYNFSPNTRFDKYFVFNTQTDSWQSVVSSSVMTPGIGYIVRSPDTFTSTPQVYNGLFSGIANNGFVTPQVYSTTGNWNLVGNPYPSAVNANAFIQLASNSNLITGGLYFWTHNTPIANSAYNYNDYAVYNLLGGTGTMAAPNVGVNNTIPNGKIASGQGFFVVASNAGALTFNNSMRLTTDNTTFFRSGQAVSNATAAAVSEIERHRIWLDISNTQGWFKQALVGYAEGATDDVDALFDGSLVDMGNDLTLYSLIDGISDSFSIQSRALPFDASDKIKLGYKATAAGNFTISMEGFDGLFENQDIYLEDKALNVIHDLKQSAYSFATEAGTFDTRFELRFTTEQLSTPDLTVSNEVTVAVKDNAIAVRSSGQQIESVRIYDLLGRKLVDKPGVQSNVFSVDNISRSQQSLIVMTKLANGATVSKKIIY